MQSFDPTTVYTAFHLQLLLGNHRTLKARSDLSMELFDIVSQPSLLGQFVRRQTPNNEGLPTGLGSGHAWLVCRAADQGELSYIHYSGGLSGEMK